MTSRIVHTCVKPVGRIEYRGPGGYRDSQMIQPGVNPADLVAKRFPNGVPAGWETEVTMFTTR